MEPKIKILIVEDEALIAENLKLSLEDLGYEVVGTCYTFSQALTQIVSNTADLILLDINLGGKNPDENGIALAYTIANTYRKPFIFLTAYSDRDTIGRATKLGPGGYLIKPVNPAALFAGIQTAFENHSGRQVMSPEAVTQVPDFFFVKMGTRRHRLLWDDVYYMEASKNYVKLRLKGNGPDYPIRGTINFVLEQLLPASLQSQFLRVNRSVCLNKRFITSYSAQDIYCGTDRFENTKYTPGDLQKLLSI